MSTTLFRSFAALTVLAVALLKPPTGFAAEEGEIPPPKDEPKIINPGPPPSDATLLFDGEDLSQWKNDKDGGAAKWEVKDGVATVNGTGGISTKRSFGDCQLHVEWA